MAIRGKYYRLGVNKGGDGLGIKHGCKRESVKRIVSCEKVLPMENTANDI